MMLMMMRTGQASIIERFFLQFVNLPKKKHHFLSEGAGCRAPQKEPLSTPPCLAAVWPLCVRNVDRQFHQLSPGGLRCVHSRPDLHMRAGSWSSHVQGRSMATNLPSNWVTLVRKSRFRPSIACAQNAPLPLTGTQPYPTIQSHTPKEKYIVSFIKTKVAVTHTDRANVKTMDLGCARLSDPLVSPMNIEPEPSSVLQEVHQRLVPGSECIQVTVAAACAWRRRMRQPHATQA